MLGAFAPALFNVAFLLILVAITVVFAAMFIRTGSLRWPTAAHVLKTVDGLLTGLHEPEASHLDLLTAFLPAEQIQAAYEDAVRRRYLWHEFGDLNLIL